jgi:uncharacterized protein (DUF2164 family)
MRNKPPIELAGDERKRAEASVQRYLAENFDADPGDVLKPALLLDYVLRELGPTIYNQALTDARKFFSERVEDLDAIGYRDEFPFWTSARKR